MPNGAAAALPVDGKNGVRLAPHPNFCLNTVTRPGGLEPGARRDQLQPLVLPQVSHLRQVPLRTRVKLPHSPQLSPS